MVDHFRHGMVLLPNLKTSQLDGPVTVLTQAWHFRLGIAHILQWWKWVFGFFLSNSLKAKLFSVTNFSRCSKPFTPRCSKLPISTRIHRLERGTIQLVQGSGSLIGTLVFPGILMNNQHNRMHQKLIPTISEFHSLWAGKRCSSDFQIVRMNWPHPQTRYITTIFLRISGIAAIILMHSGLSSLIM